ncbi:hypothetical protein M011DRAFT_459016 [Sporormia fimetaria CBS 119925]|uniref:Uncharacterized protein n=1 Tax=Sporormia fimetaria CBS 119925 TaxID=1340428 RepID=A0A6A6VAN9_9PLEO|nr:hypothetical protein M011DRAFT_459016 [Sporormia fimetaria CBS 119925]
MSATTPLRAAMPAHASPVKSSGRRVLGELTPRAVNVNTPTKQTNRHGHVHDVFDTVRARSPLKQVTTQSSLQIEDKENAGVMDVFKSGKKRGFEEVEGNAHMGDAKRFEHFDMRQPTSRPQSFAQKPSENTSHSRSSSTEPDSPPPTHTEPPNTQDTLPDSQKSFSNFVDWTECASQPTEQPPLPQQPPSKATLLRLRLSLATYKLKTNQITTPLADLLTSFESSISTSSDTITPTSHTKAENIPSITLSPARTSPQGGRTANLDPGNPIPKLSMAPVLLPTSFSTRFIQNSHVPSSPPQHNAPTCVSPEDVMSPSRPEYHTPAARRIRETGYNDMENEEGEEMGTEDMSVGERLRVVQEQGGEVGLTSSVVKGRAAEMLLELGLGGGRR